MCIAQFLVLVLLQSVALIWECYPERAVVMQNPFDYLYRDHDVEGMSDG